MIRVHQLSDRATRDERLRVMLPLEDDGPFNALVRDLWERGMYDCVAHVPSDNLNTAYRVTNSIDCGWWENPLEEVEPKFAGDGCRSTSVGDVLTVDSEPCCRIHAVASFGFNQIAVGPPRNTRAEQSLVATEAR